MDSRELLELTEERALAYEFLARAYRTAPDAAFIAALRTAGKNQRDGIPLASFFVELDKADDEQLRIDLAADYNRLFLGMGPHPVPPYESVYTSAEGLLMQEARDEVLKTYHAAGLAAPQGFDLPEDHLSIELTFMAHMAERTKEALEAGEDAKADEFLTLQAGFLDAHLARWVPQFSRDVATQAHTTFFRELAGMTCDQIDADLAILEEIAA